MLSRVLTVDLFLFASVLSADRIAGTALAAVVYLLLSWRAPLVLQPDDKAYREKAVTQYSNSDSPDRLTYSIAYLRLIRPGRTDLFI
jgi:hypothetical protein